MCLPKPGASQRGAKKREEEARCSAPKVVRRFGAVLIDASMSHGHDLHLVASHVVVCSLYLALLDARVVSRCHMSIATHVAALCHTRQRALLDRACAGCVR